LPETPLLDDLFPEQKVKPVEESMRIETPDLEEAPSPDKIAEFTKDLPVLPPTEAITEPPITEEKPKGFVSDPVVPTPAKGEPGFAGMEGRPGGEVTKPWLDDEKIKSPDEEIESFFGRTRRQPYSKKASGFVNTIIEGLRERFVTRYHIPKVEKYALFHDMIRTMPEERRMAGEKAIKDIVNILENDGTVQSLDSHGFDLLRRKVFVQDILREAEVDRSASGDLKFEQLQLENARLDYLISKVPSVKKAYEARQTLWRGVSKDLFERGVIDEEAAKNETYVRHFVLDLAERNRPIGFRRKKLAAPYRAYTKMRKGSKRDISTDYLAVEIRALSDIYMDNAVEDMANKISELANKRKFYTNAAREANFIELVGGEEIADRIYELRANIKESQEGPDAQESDAKQIRRAWIEELTELDPTYSYRVKIAIGLSKLNKLEMIDSAEEDTTLFKQLAAIVKEDPDSDAGIAARTVFKGITGRNNLIKKTLGDRLATPENLALQDDYVEWFYKRPNLFYRAATMNEAKVAALIENVAEDAGEMIQIPKNQIRTALVLGRRKGMLIPRDLAMQLDDLPVNKTSNMVIESFTKPFVKLNKRWYLRVNPLRYNGRNNLGDTEAIIVNGQEASLVRIPEAVKMLMQKTGVEYEIAKRYGAVGSSLWHEMGDFSRMPEFEKFKKITTQKDFVEATKSVFGAPLRLVQKVGNIEQTLTQFREDILRAAVFLHNYERLRQGKPVRHWAGRISHINEIAKTDIGRAAAKISRETLGDYGEFTPFENNVLRQGLIYFYSWMKINGLRYPKAIRGATTEGLAGKATLRAASQIGLNVSTWLIRAMGIYAAANLWNHRNDEAIKKEESLPMWLREQPHVNIGDYTVWGQTAMSDYSEWFGWEELQNISWRHEAGFIDQKEAALEAAKAIARAPVNKVYQALNPFLKAPVVAIGGVETYPDVFKPRIVAPPASQKSMERAILDIIGADAKRFYQSIGGDKAFDDTLYAYFAGWFVRPTDAETMIEEVKRTKTWTTLKTKSEVTGRKPGQAKKGREAEWQEAKIREKALGVRIPVPSKKKTRKRGVK
jgi:hypothetical protein